MSYERNTLELNKLLKYREKLNLTQEELAEKAGVSTRTIQRIEKGTEPKGHTLKVLAKALGVSEDNLKENKSQLKTKAIDYQMAKYINLSSIFGVVLPPLNILLPFFIMRYKKQLNEVNKQIVSIQIIWALSFLIIMILVNIIGNWFSVDNEIVPLAVILIIIINLYIILRNTVELDKNQKLHISLKFSII